MNKSGLIDAISTTTSLTKRETENAVNASVHAVVSEVRAGHRVFVVGFVTFNPTQRGVRMGRSPQSGAPVTIEVTTAHPAAALKETTEQSTKIAVRRAQATHVVQTPVGKISRRTPAPTAAKRAPARKTAKRSANKAVRRAPANRPAKYAPARKAAKLSAKKAVRRA